MCHQSASPHGGNGVVWPVPVPEAGLKALVPGIPFFAQDPLYRTLDRGLRLRLPVAAERRRRWLRSDVLADLLPAAAAAEAGGV